MKLTPGEENYLKTISSTQVVHIRPYNPKQQQIADEIILKIKNVFPESEIILIGATALRILGQGDIDLSVISNPESFEEYMPKLIKLFGNPVSQNREKAFWKIIIDGYQIELYLTSKDKKILKQIQIFDKLKNNPKLLKEYELLKEAFNGKLMRDYQRSKYEFYHRILGN